jgi:uncharacterized protein YjbJ (UPF0337 family)
MRPNEDEIRGKVDKAAGTVKEKVGRLTNNPNLVNEGADQRAGGEIEEGFGKAKRKVGEAVRDLGEKINR